MLHGDRPKKPKRMEMYALEIFPIPAPVIFVMDLGPNTNKQEVQLALRSALQEAQWTSLSTISEEAPYEYGRTKRNE